MVSISELKAGSLTVVFYFLKNLLEGLAHNFYEIKRFNFIFVFKFVLKFNSRQVFPNLGFTNLRTFTKDIIISHFSLDNDFLFMFNIKDHFTLFLENEKILLKTFKWSGIFV